MDEPKSHVSTRREALCRLFVLAFNDAELRQFMAFLPGADGLLLLLPGPTVSLAGLALAAVQLLERSRLCGVALAQLSIQRPSYSSEIEQVRVLYADAGDDGEEAPLRGPPFRSHDACAETSPQMSSRLMVQPRWFSLRLRIGCLTIVATLGILAGIYTAAMMVETPGRIASNRTWVDPEDEVLPAPMVWRPDRDEPTRSVEIPRDAAGSSDSSPDPPLVASPTPRDTPPRDPRRIVAGVMRRAELRISAVCGRYLSPFDESRVIDIMVRVEGDDVMVHLDEPGIATTTLGRCVEQELAALRFPRRGDLQGVRSSVRIRRR